jgi:small redox-active disulfide protein 2
MKVQVLGSGCAKCKLLEANARQAAAELGPDITVEKVSDMETMASMGIMSTPALAVDGVVKSSGRVLTKDQVLALLKG